MIFNLVNWTQAMPIYAVGFILQSIIGKREQQEERERKGENIQGKRSSSKNLDSTRMQDPVSPRPSHLKFHGISEPAPPRVCSESTPVPHSLSSLSHSLSLSLSLSLLPPSLPPSPSPSPSPSFSLTLFFSAPSPFRREGVSSSE